MEKHLGNDPNYKESITGSLLFSMRYHYERNKTYGPIFGELHFCDHPVYSRCTLFRIRDKGLAVIQQRYDPVTKATYWTQVDDDLWDALFMHPSFKRYFDERAGNCEKDIYPTVTVRQMMWALKMKPLKREQWETCFDRKLI